MATSPTSTYHRQVMVDSLNHRRQYLADCCDRAQQRIDALITKFVEGAETMTVKELKSKIQQCIQVAEKAERIGQPILALRMTEQAGRLRKLIKVTFFDSSDAANTLVELARPFKKAKTG
jgi:hypothetical protein